MEYPEQLSFDFKYPEGPTDKYLSNCCGARPDMEVDFDGETRSGRCSKCKEGAMFFTEEELEQLGS